MRALFVETPGNHQLHHLLLTWRQQIETLTKLPDLSSLRACFSIIFQCIPDCIHQLFFSYRFGQEMNGAGLQSMHRHRNIAMAGKENDGQRNTGVVHFALQVQSAHSRHVNVEDHTPLGFHRFNGEKFQRRPECLHGQAYRFNQRRQPFPNRYIVVDQENDLADLVLHVSPDRHAVARSTRSGVSA